MLKARGSSAMDVEDMSLDQLCEEITKNKNRVRQKSLYTTEELVSNAYQRIKQLSPIHVLDPGIISKLLQHQTLLVTLFRNEVAAASDMNALESCRHLLISTHAFSDIVDHSNIRKLQTEFGAKFDALTPVTVEEAKSDNTDMLALLALVEDFDHLCQRSQQVNLAGAMGEGVEEERALLSDTSYVFQAEQVRNQYHDDLDVAGLTKLHRYCAELLFKQILQCAGQQCVDDNKERLASVATSLYQHFELYLRHIPLAKALAVLDEATDPESILGMMLMDGLEIKDRARIGQLKTAYVSVSKDGVNLLDFGQLISELAKLRKGENKSTRHRSSSLSQPKVEYDREVLLDVVFERLSMMRLLDDVEEYEEVLQHFSANLLERLLASLESCSTHAEVDKIEAKLKPCKVFAAMLAEEDRIQVDEALEEKKSELPSTEAAVVVEVAEGGSGEDEELDGLGRLLTDVIVLASVNQHAQMCDQIVRSRDGSMAEEFFTQELNTLRDQVVTSSHIHQLYNHAVYLLLEQIEAFGRLDASDKVDERFMSGIKPYVSDMFLMFKQQVSGVQLEKARELLDAANDPYTLLSKIILPNKSSELGQLMDKVALREIRGERTVFNVNETASFLAQLQIFQEQFTQHKQSTPLSSRLRGSSMSAARRVSGESLKFDSVDVEERYAESETLGPDDFLSAAHLEGNGGEDEDSPWAAFAAGHEDSAATVDANTETSPTTTSPTEGSGKDEDLSSLQLRFFTFLASANPFVLVTDEMIEVLGSDSLEEQRYPIFDLFKRRLEGGADEKSGLEQNHAENLERCLKARDIRTPLGQFFRSKVKIRNRKKGISDQLLAKQLELHNLCMKR